MRYTEYFRERINNSGKPVNLSNQQLIRVNEIVMLEGLITGNTENGVIVDTSEKRYRRSKNLRELTRRKKPEDLWFEIIKCSEASRK